MHRMRTSPWAIALSSVVLLAGACHTTADKWAAFVARSQMEGFMSAAAIARSEVEVRPSYGSWMVIFHDANLTCTGDGPYGPGACRGVHFGEVVYQDAFTCVPSVPWMGTLHRGASRRRIGPADDPCNPGRMPPAEPPAAETRPSPLRESPEPPS
jgi:hypothetical protein